ncbi:MAG: hypothetical protein RIT26_183 [Pseudomonadota bacterium]
MARPEKLGSDPNFGSQAMNSPDVSWYASKLGKSCKTPYVVASQTRAPLARSESCRTSLLSKAFKAETQMLKYLTIPVTPFQQNCSLVWDDQSQQAAVIDPGGDVDRILAAVKKLGLKLEQIWITHAHVDHAAATAELAESLDLPIHGPHPEDQFWIDGLAQAAAMYQFPPAKPFQPTRWLHDGDTVSIGAHTLQVRHCPGHTPGHVVFYSPEIGRAFVGDVLFAGSIGRTDFPRGDYDTLIGSITQRLWPMGNETVFIPGHGPESTFGRERQTNPFVGGT